MTGWRVGWVVGPADVVKAATNLQSHATSNVANVSQAAAVAALTGDLSAAAAMREAFDRRRSEEHTSELQSRQYLVCRLLLEKKKTKLQTTQAQFYILILV